MNILAVEILILGLVRWIDREVGVAREVAHKNVDIYISDILGKDWSVHCFSIVGLKTGPRRNSLPEC